METTGYSKETFDRMLGSLHGLPDVISAGQTSKQAVTPMTGVSQFFIVQTYRQKDAGDTIFLQCVTEGGTIRLAIPPQVAAAIARQRETLTKKSRSRAARTLAQARTERGELPGFMKTKTAT